MMMRAERSFASAMTRKRANMRVCGSGLAAANMPMTLSTLPAITGPAFPPPPAPRSPRSVAALRVPRLALWPCPRQTRDQPIEDRRHSRELHRADALARPGLCLAALEDVRFEVAFPRARTNARPFHEEEIRS